MMAIDIIFCSHDSVVASLQILWPIPIPTPTKLFAGSDHSVRLLSVVWTMHTGLFFVAEWQHLAPSDRTECQDKNALCYYKREKDSVFRWLNDNLFPSVLDSRHLSLDSKYYRKGFTFGNFRLWSSSYLVNLSLPWVKMVASISGLVKMPSRHVCIQLLTTAFLWRMYC